MRVIRKQISLEPMTSRLPGVVPAYKDGKLYFFDEKSLKDREYAYPSNYGMIPATLGFATAPSATTNPSISSTCGFRLSWEEFSKWFYFFRNYYHLLNDWGHCHVKYNSAMDYYNHESKNGYANQMIYGSEESTYQDIDDTFSSYGGKAFYDYACQYIVPSFDIPIAYIDYWHNSKLYYPDIIKWQHWFANRYAKYGDKTNVNECSGEADCCDCTEYVNRGGATMYELLNAAYNSIQSSIETITISMKDGNNLHSCFEPSIILPTSVQVSIDDLGEMSIFSEEYVLGRDYRVTSFDKLGDTDNTKGGTVVSVSGNSMVLKDGNAGFGFDTDYMEKFYDESQWDVHKGDTEVDGIPEEDEYVRYYQNPLPTYEYYGYSSNSTKATGDSEDAVRAALAKEYPVTTINAFMINGSLYNVQTEEYGEYNGKKYPVYRELSTDTPYTTIKGKKIYAEFYPYNGVSKCYYFPMFTVSTPGSGGPCNLSDFNPRVYKWYPRVRSSADFNFILYGGTIYEVTSTGTGVGGTKVTGMFYNDDGTFYIVDGAVNIFNEFGFEIDGSYTYDSSTNTAKKNNDEEIEVYKAGYVEGKAESKLYRLRSDNLLTDDVGNMLPGKYNTSSTYRHQPPEGTELDIIYEVGNVSEIAEFSGLTSSDKTKTENFFYGNYLSAMMFYFIDTAGNKYPSGGQTGETSLEAIQTLNSSKPEYEQEASDNGATLRDMVYCDVVYYIGATLKRTAGSNKYTMAEGEYSKGVEYRETVRFVATDVQYYLKGWEFNQIPTNKNAESAHSISYPVVCYILNQDLTEIDSEFGNKYTCALADFSMKLPTNDGYKGYKAGLQLFPVFRQEYTLGNSVMQKVDVDIYIDRGMNAAFEKHIKLGEVTSLEALEQYTNGYFKMMEN